MYTAHYINPLEQFGKIGYDLILVDDENILPELRISKNFDVSVTLEQMEQEAQRAIAEYSQQPTISVTIDEAQ